MNNLLSIAEKQALSRDSNSSLKWEDLDSADRRLVMAVCFSESVEEARKDLNLSIGGFYKRWKYLKPIYTSLLDDLPTQAISILKAGSQKAAKTLVDSLEASSAGDKIKAANSILDRVTPERAQISAGSYKRVTFEQWVKGTPEVNADQTPQTIYEVT